MKFLFVFAAMGLGASGVSFAGTPGLVIHAAEIGVAKFHRADNKVHPMAYGPNHAWTPYILPDSVAMPLTGPLVVDNPDQSVTIFFSNLDELMASAIEVSDSHQAPVAVLNVHGHGLPGAMWFPATADAQQSADCAPWVAAATGDDSDNYTQYYSAVSADEMTEIQQFSQSTTGTAPCTTGFPEWSAGVAKAPRFARIFSEGAQVHFLSCVVGMGEAGDQFTGNLAALLLGGGSPEGRIETSMDYGLSDWSMPEGMGFWNEETPDQLTHDDAIYPVDRSDREIYQLGSIRVATASGASWGTSLVSGVAYMLTSYDDETVPPPGGAVTPPDPRKRVKGPKRPAPQRPTAVRIPGTSIRVPVTYGGN